MSIQGVQNMQIRVNWSSQVSEKFAELAICIGIINDVHVEKENEQIQELKEAVETTISYIKLVSGGETETIKVFETPSKS